MDMINYKAVLDLTATVPINQNDQIGINIIVALLFGLVHVLFSALPRGLATYKTMSDKSIKDFPGLVCSMIHSSVALYYVNHMLALCEKDPDHIHVSGMVKDKSRGYSRYAEILISFVRGYFVYDVILAIVHRAPVDLAHGALSLITYITCSSGYYMYFGILFLMYEVSTIFLDIWKITECFGYDKTLKKVKPNFQTTISLSQKSFALSFYTFRILNGLIVVISPTAWKSSGQIQWKWGYLWQFLHEMYLDESSKVNNYIKAIALMVGLGLNGLTAYWAVLIMHKALFGHVSSKAKETLQIVTGVTSGDVCAILNTNKDCVRVDQAEVF